MFKNFKNVNMTLVFYVEKLGINYFTLFLP